MGEEKYGTATSGAHVKKVEAEGHEEDWEAPTEEKEEESSEETPKQSSGLIDYNKL